MSRSSSGTSVESIRSGFKFFLEREEKLIQGLSVEEATAAVAEAEADLEAGKKASHRKKKGKKQAPPSSDDEHADGGEGSSDGGGGGKDQKELEIEVGDEGKDKESSDEAFGERHKSVAASDPSDPGSSSDESDDDAARIRGHVSRVQTRGQSRKKLYKMIPPSK